MRDKHCIPPLQKWEARHLGEVLFWHQFLGHTPFPIPEEVKLSLLAQNSEVEDLAVLIFGLVAAFPNNLYISTLQDGFLLRFQKKFIIPYIKINGTEIKAHFLIDIFHPDFDDQGDSNYIHQRKLQILRLLRLAFPDFETYSTQGYGHKLITEITTYDSSIAHISRANLVNPFLRTINSISRNLMLWPYRSVNWKDFVDRELALRNSFLNISEALRLRLIKYFKGKRTSNALHVLVDETDSILENVESSNLIPKSISDKLGMISEQQEAKSYHYTVNPFDNLSEDIGSPDASPVSNKIYSQINPAREGYFRKMNSFFSQCKHVIVFTGRTGLLGPENFPHVSRANIQGGYLDLLSYQQKFSDLFGKYLIGKDEENLIRREQQTLLDILTMWESFTSPQSNEGLPFVTSGMARLRGHKATFESAVKSNLNKIVDDLGVEIEVVFKPEDRIMFAVIDFQSLVEIYTIIERVYSALCSAYGERHPYELGATMLELNYKEFVVIPLIYGKALNANAYKFHLFDLQGSDSSSMKIARWIQVPISGNYFEELSIEFWKDEFEKPVNFKRSIDNLSVNIHRIAELKSLQELIIEETTGYDLYVEFISNAKTLCERAFKDIQIPLTAEFENLSALIETGTLQEIDSELIHAIGGLWTQILPPGISESENEEITFRIGDWIQWNEKMNDARPQIEVVYYTWLETLIVKMDQCHPITN